MPDAGPQVAGQPLAAAPRGSPPRWQVALSNIPAPVTPLVGRQSELAEAVALLRGPALRLLTLTGPGGVGKTRLALAIAAEVDAVFDSRHFVSLAHLRAPGQLPTAIAEAMGLPDGAAADAPLDRVVTRLRPARSLLVLDTFEHLIEAAPLVANLLADCPRLAVLVSSRAPLRLRGEHELPVAPLPLPAPSSEALGLDELRASPAIALFCQRARAVSPPFALG